MTENTAHCYKVYSSLNNELAKWSVYAYDHKEAIEAVRETLIHQNTAVLAVIK